MRQYKLYFVALLIMPLLFSCSKDDDENNDPPKEIDYQILAEDAGLLNKLSDDAFNEIDRRTKSGEIDEDGKTEFYLAADTCAIITLAPGSALGQFPITFVIDFGTGRTCLGVTRKGKIFAEFSGLYRTVGTVVTVTFDNYYVDNHKIDGIKTITNDGLNNNGKLTFTVKDINGVITKPNGGTITWNSERTNTWTSGENTLIYVCDDVYGIDGYAEGVTSQGHTYRFDVIETLENKVCCYGLTDGIIRYNINNGQLVADVDYSSATCYVTTVTLIVNGNSIVVII